MSVGEHREHPNPIRNLIRGRADEIRPSRCRDLRDRCREPLPGTTLRDGCALPPALREANLRVALSQNSWRWRRRQVPATLRPQWNYTVPAILITPVCKAT